MKSITFEFPFLPPSVNQAYYTDFASRSRHKSAKYRQFIKDISQYIPQQTAQGEVEIEYNFYFPDKRRRDVANYEKALSDTLVHYGTIEDDSKIQRMVLEKYYRKKEPLTVIQINELN